VSDNGHNKATRSAMFSPVAWLRDLPRDSPAKAVVVTLLVCIFASAMVTSSAIVLRPKHKFNRQIEQNRQIAEIVETAAREGGLWRDIKVSDLDMRVVDLATGKYIENIDPASFDRRKLLRDPSQIIRIPADKDLAKIKIRANRAVIHLLQRDGRTVLVVLPVYGRGFGSTLHGYLGLSGDAKTVTGLVFFEHGETPGLGALIDAPDWRRLWFGKKVWDARGEVGLGVARGPVVAGTPEAEHYVDGLTGATWTGQGVTNLLRYWLGEHGFGPYLKRLRRTAQ
jgi:Na+-transporting NADH:ubiquinone oxidoreductase subunit C